MKTRKLLTIFPFLATLFTSTSCQSKQVPIKDYILTIPYKKNFKILQLTDIHFSSLEDDAWLDKHFAFMDETIDMASVDGHRPDLIVITGDSSYEGDKHVVDRLFNWLDEKEIPWTITFGNHDTRAYYSLDWLLNRITQSKYSLFKDMGDDGVHGDANYAVNIVDEATHEIKDQVIMLDSNRYRPGDYKFESYDYIYPNQINWYKRLVKYTTKQNGGKPVPSYICFHIQPHEFKEAWEIYDKYKDDPEKLKEYEVAYHHDDGVKGEGFALPKMNTGIFNAIRELGSTKAIIVGHDHCNDHWMTYKGIHLAFGVKSTGHNEIVYCSENMLGGRIYNLDDVNNENFSKIFLHKYDDSKIGD